MFAVDSISVCVSGGKLPRNLALNLAQLNFDCGKSQGQNVLVEKPTETPKVEAK